MNVNGDRDDDVHPTPLHVKGVDGAVVSYPGANGGEVGRKVGFSRRGRYSVPGTAPTGNCLF